MATQGVSRYIDAQYLPDPSDLPEGETFVICKPATMKMSVFRPWVACLCKRQQARNSVDPDMKILYSRVVFSAANKEVRRIYMTDIEDSVYCYFDYCGVISRWAA